MFLENVVFDSTQPTLLGRFWEQAFGGQQLTDEPAGYETRLAVAGGPVLDLCFQFVAEKQDAPQRLHLDVSGGAEQEQIVDRLVALGAVHVDIGQGDVPWVVLADPEGNTFCVMEGRAEYASSGPLAALPLDVAEPERERAFWAWLSGWVPVEGSVPSLQHRSLRGPLLEMCPESAPKSAAKNQIHLDIRLEPGDDAEAVVAGIVERGGRELHLGFGDLPWRHFADPSGNEFCVLPAPS